MTDDKVNIFFRKAYKSNIDKYTVIVSVIEVVKELGYRPDAMDRSCCFTTIYDSPKTRNTEVFR